MNVRAGEWSMPWNARDGVGRVGPGIPTSDLWASAKEGIDHVGCVYTTQGFEFDYVGVIVGPDLVYRPMGGGWVGQRDQSHDRVVRRGVTEAEFTRYVKSTYRVLLTRGLRGCYVYFMDAPRRVPLARNELHLPRGTRVFFGLTPRSVPRMTLLGNLEIRHGGIISQRHMRFGHNHMDTIDLPIPGVDGPAT